VDLLGHAAQGKRAGWPGVAVRAGMRRAGRPGCPSREPCGAARSAHRPPQPAAAGYARAGRCPWGSTDAAVFSLLGRCQGECASQKNTGMPAPARSPRAAPAPCPDPRSANGVAAPAAGPSRPPARPGPPRRYAARRAGAAGW
jgi:hypothetical protein